MMPRLRPAAWRERYAQFKDVRSGRHSRILFTEIEASPERTILVRIGLVLAALALVVVTFWFDRSGLVDSIDGEVSFADVLYFTMVTVTTVGYGDIVPVTERARLIDAFLVTPVRIFVWFVFLGTAYELVIQRVLEDFRMSKVQQQLREHIVICGYGTTGQVAAREMLAKGFPPDKIVVIDLREENLRAAAQNGFIGLRGDAAREEVMRRAMIERAKVVIISPGRDDTSVLIVLTIRNVNPRVKIVAVVTEHENFKLIRQAGANVIVSPSRVGGYLVADAVTNWHVADYVMDLLTANGRVRLVERPATAEEAGRRPAEITDGLLVRIYRGGEHIGFWDTEKNTVQPGDILLMIVPGEGETPASA